MGLLNILQERRQRGPGLVLGRRRLRGGPGDPEAPLGEGSSHLGAAADVDGALLQLLGGNVSQGINSIP